MEKIEVDENIVLASRNALARSRQRRIEQARSALAIMAEKYYNSTGHTQEQHATGYIGCLVQLYDALTDDAQFDAAQEIKAFLRENFIEVSDGNMGHSRWNEMKVPTLPTLEEPHGEGV